MRALPEDVQTSALLEALADGWGFSAVSGEYAAVGAGSYHWVVIDSEGTRGFVTVDDLDQKGWLGVTRESTFAGLTRCLDTAHALRDSGLGFVVAPMPTSKGETVRRLAARHTVALFPFVDGEAGRYGEYTATDRAAVIAMLAELHVATPAVASVARSVGLEISGRDQLENGLRELDQKWLGGPFSEPAREALARHAPVVAGLLAFADRLAADVGSRGGDWVVTHGEPHAANIMRTSEGYLLVDWDTVALAPPERDLWMVVREGTDDAAAYTETTGHPLDEAALSCFRLTWDLKDLAERVNQLRTPHQDTEDTASAYDWMASCSSLRDHAAALLES